MTVEELQASLRAARAAIGYGRFALTLSDGPLTSCYLTHWFFPDQYAPEDCRAVGSGTVAECLDALNRYVASNALITAYSIAAE